MHNDLLKSLGELSDRVKTIFRPLLQCFEEDCIDFSGQLGLKGTRWLRRDTQVLIHQMHRIAPVRGTPSEQFIGHDRQGILVGGEDWLSLTLFGSHVDRGTSQILT